MEGLELLERNPCRRALKNDAHRSVIAQRFQVQNGFPMMNLQPFVYSS